MLNFIVLYLLLLLFFALYRRRPSDSLRFWLAGWLTILIHFAILLLTPDHVRGLPGMDAVAAETLLLAGCCFLLSRAEGVSLRRCAATLAGLAVPTLALTGMLACGVHRPALLLPCGLLLQGFLLVLFWRFDLFARRTALAGTLIVLACSQWSLLALASGRAVSALSALCTEVFTLNALLFLAQGLHGSLGQSPGHSSARSSGLWTVSLGFLAWAAVFPVSMLTQVWWPAISVNPEIWNAPKLAVALGMLLMLFEHELNLTEREREQYRSLFDGNPLPMWIFEAESTRLVEVNAAAVRTFGWGSADLESLTAENLLAGDQQGPVGITEMNWSLAGAGEQPFSSPVEPLEARRMVFETKAGDAVPVEVSLQRVQFQGKEARLLVAKDITAELKARDQLVHLANHDPLTGLPNRLLLHDRMELALAKAARNGSKVAVVCVDLDRFKLINDTYGHAAGDSCLREVAARFRRRLRSVDTVARTGGEEFTIILDDIGRLEDAEGVINDLLFALGPPHSVDGRPIQLSASIGLALAPEHSENASELMVQADKAMYRAKQSGGNRHRVFSQAV